MSVRQLGKFTLRVNAFFPPIKSLPLCEKEDLRPTTDTIFRREPT